MSIKHSLLALLGGEARYGYELKTEFEERTSGAWPLNIGQVYTTLDRLARDGLVEAAGVDEQDRTLYRATPAGRAQAQAWFLAPLEISQPPRDELAIKLAIAVTLPDVDVVALIQAQRTATLHTLQTYTQAKRDADPDDIAWQLIVEQMIFSARAQVDWLDLCEARVARLRRPARRASSAPARRTAVAR